MVSEMEEMLDAAYELAMLQTSVYHWYKEFKSGGKSGGIDRPGAPTTMLPLLHEGSDTLLLDPILIICCLLTVRDGNKISMKYQCVRYIDI